MSARQTWEQALLAACLAAGPAVATTTGLRVEFQYEVELDGRRYVLDFAVPAVKVGVEIDGLDTRATRVSIVSRGRALGWTLALLRYTSTHLRRRRTAIRRELTRLVASRVHGLGRSSGPMA
jgi:very-short-patch-repair endonuclease